MGGVTVTQRTGLAPGAVCWIVGALVFVAFEGVAAAAVVPTYSYVDGYISDLGVPAWSPNAVLMNAGLWVQGLMFLAGAVLITRTLRRGWALGVLAVAVAAGNILVAVVHGGSSWYENGFAWLHVLGALLVIVGGNTAILVGSSVVSKSVDLPSYRVVSIAIALLGFVGLVITTIATSTHATDMAVGAAERVSVYSILAWQVFSGFLLLTRRR